MASIMVSDATASVAVDLVRSMLADRQAGWSLGTFGALAEFSRVAGDPELQVHLSPDGGTILSRRGALRVSVPAGVQPVAYEGLSHRFDAWTQTVSFCLPAPQAAMGQRVVLTELGPDRDALRADEQDHILFDVGLGAPHMDFCVRTRDTALLRHLRATAGAAPFDPSADVMAAVKDASPTRVCRSRLGRIEVYQPIASRRRGIPLPPGPHTHVWPQLLRSRRTHSANAPIPEGWLPVLDLHPGSPVVDAEGRARPFDPALHQAFQRLLERHAPSGYIEEKMMIAAAVVAEVPPERYPQAESRAARKGARIALRQMLHTLPDAPQLRHWLAVLDRGAGTCGADTHV